MPLQLLQWMYRATRTVGVEEMEEPNLKARRLGIAEVVIVHGISRPPASMRARLASQYQARRTDRRFLRYRTP
jgi:hypothetical protein